MQSNFAGSNVIIIAETFTGFNAYADEISTDIAVLQ